MAIDEPERLAERAGKVRHGGIHGNDQIQILDQRRGIREVVEVGGPVDDLMVERAAVQLLERIAAFLQAIEFTVAHLQDRRQLVELETALAVDPVGARQAFSRIARPYQPDSWSFLVAEAVAPGARLFWGCG